MATQNALTNWDEIESQIDEARDLKTIVQMQEQMEALKILAKQTDGGLRTQNRCSKYRIMLEQNAGQIYKNLPEERGRRNSHNDSANSTTKQEAESETGKHRNTLQRWAKESVIKRDTLEEYEAECNDEGKEFTSAGLLHYAREKEEPIASPPLPDGKYEVILADPPWAYDTPQSTVEVCDHYPTLTLDELCNFRDENGQRINNLAHVNCVLYLWATMGRLNWAFPVLEAWGFKYKTHMVWDKVKHNMGHYCSARHELLLIAGKGDCDPDDKVIANSIDSVQVIPKTKIHSRKPEAFHEIIEKLYPDKKKIELFARNKRRGWDVWGNEIWEFSQKTNR